MLLYLTLQLFLRTIQKHGSGEIHYRNQEWNLKISLKTPMEQKKGTGMYSPHPTPIPPATPFSPFLEQFQTSTLEWARRNVACQLEKDPAVQSEWHRAIAGPGLMKQGREKRGRRCCGSGGERWKEIPYGRRGAWLSLGTKWLRGERAGKRHRLSASTSQLPPTSPADTKEPLERGWLAVIVLTRFF